MKAALAVALALTLAGCGKTSMLGAELDRDLADADRAISRGDVEEGCAKLGSALPRYAEWAEHARGERAARANRLVETISMTMQLCSAPVGSAASPASLQASWRPTYAEIREISTYKTTWLTVFTYVSMLAVGIGMYVFLRRMRK
jgi:hypothetical protein